MRCDLRHSLFYRFGCGYTYYIIPNYNFVVRNFIRPILYLWALFQLNCFHEESWLKANVACETKSKPKPIKAIKLLGARGNEKMVLLRYDNEEDVEWVYDMDLEVDETFINQDEPENLKYDIENMVPIWEDMF